MEAKSQKFIQLLFFLQEQMSEVAIFNNPEIQHELQKYQKQKTPLGQSSQNEIPQILIEEVQFVSSSIQVNMDEEICDTQKKDQKRNKKKEYKRRKREKKRAIQEQAKISLGQIIQNIYRGKTNFEIQQQKIEQHLKQLMDGNKFNQFLDNVIRSHVSNIQYAIWEQLIVFKNEQDSDEDETFCLLMVDRIYRQYKSLQLSSREIEKIICFYVKLGNNNTCIDEKYEIDRNTFKFLIQSDQDLKSQSLLCYCRRRISLYHHKQHRELDEIQEILRPRIYEDEQDYFYEQMSTEVDEQQVFEREKLLKQKKKKKKLRKEEENLTPEKVIQRLDNMRINDCRQMCNVQENWISNMSKKIQQQNGSSLQKSNHL